MRNVILVAVILHLVITVVKINGDYTFGDIISFPRKCAKINRFYKHFAVYVGPKQNLFGQGNKDIFHRLRKPTDGQYCVFGTLNNEPKHQKENYLDRKWKKSSDEDIIKHIKAMIQDCGIYNLRTNNCEHLATYVRYGRAHLKQPGTKVTWLCKLLGGERSCPEADEAARNMPDEEILRILEELHSNSETEDECFNESNVAAG